MGERGGKKEKKKWDLEVTLRGIIFKNMFFSFHFHQGHDFRPAYLKLKVLKARWPSVPLIAVTATAKQKVQNDIVKSLGLVSPAMLRSSCDRPNLHYTGMCKKKKYISHYLFLFLFYFVNSFCTHWLCFSCNERLHHWIWQRVWRSGRLYQGYEWKCVWQ